MRKREKPCGCRERERERERESRSLNHKKVDIREAGITLIALVVTIIVLLILAGVTISIVLGSNGLLSRAQDTSNTYANATKNETRAMSELADKIDELTGKTLAEEKIAAVNAKTTLQTIAYSPKVTSAEVKIEPDNNGGQAEQSITQTNLGVSSLNWYVLSADKNGVNIVSDATSSSNKITFKDAGGYDNCLYYLNEIATNLFANEESYGVDGSRVHALRLTDIKYAAEQMNGSSYSWETTFENGALSKANPVGETKTYTDSRYTKYPKIYGTSTGAVTTNNIMKDEDPSENGVPIAGDNSSTASSLTVTNTSYSYYKAYDSSGGRTSMINNLSTFGGSGVAEKLFDASGTTYWLASRSASADITTCTFSLRRVVYGYLEGGSLCESSGNTFTRSNALRVVVSIPGSRVNISEDGTVTLK